MAKKAEKPADPFRQTRSQHANETAEDYVEAVADFIESHGECRVRDLALHFDVSHVTVSRIVSRLVSEDLLITEPYRPITLTGQGNQLAKRVKLRHQIVFEFLLSLGIDEKTARNDSEGIEHHVSQKTLAAMKRFLKDKNE
ncbi:MAG: manganese-binding transcriptional regulator MntR [Planctomycetota bacterium]